MSTFIDHACHSRDDTDVEAEMALASLLSENERLLDELITPDIVKQFETLAINRVRNVFAHPPLVL